MTVKQGMAKRFRFRLDVVERVRRQVRDKQRRVVADAVRAARQMEDHVASVTDQLRRSVRETASTQSRASLDVALVRTQEFHRNWLHRQMMDARMELEQRQKALASKRHELAEATKQLRVIEKLRDRQWQRHVIEVKREEHATHDEVAITQYLRASDDVVGGGTQ